MLSGLWKPAKTIRAKNKRKKKDSTATLALKQLLSAPKNKKLLVLDLDETLVHSTSKGSSRNHDVNSTLIEVLIEKHSCLYYVYKRPHVNYFLKKVSEWYKIVIYTASVREYADPVIDWLDSEKVVSNRLFRDSCVNLSDTENTFFKNLGCITQDLSSVVLIDNSPSAFVLQPNNGILVKSWTDDQNDECLLDLVEFLDALRFTNDVRSVLHFNSFGNY